VGIRAAPGAGLGHRGGIGFYIQLYIRPFQYDKVATLTPKRQPRSVGNLPATNRRP
jgi:hypothetical protein